MESLRSLIYRWRRLAYGRPFKHMALALPGFAMRACESGAFDIYWRGEVVGSTRPLSDVRDSGGKDLFIACTGPSLSTIEFERLRGCEVIGVNGAIVRFLESGFSPQHYVIVDPDFFQNRFELVREAILSGARCFFSFAGLSYICRHDPGLLSKAPIYLLDAANRRFGAAALDHRAFERYAVQQPQFVLHPAYSRAGDIVGFSKNAELGVFTGRTVAVVALQVGYYLGARQFFLLGLDLGADGSQVRFYETEGQARRSDLEQDYETAILPSFEVVRELCSRREIGVFNLSSASRLPEAVVPRLTLAQALAKVANPPTACLAPYTVTPELMHQIS